MNIFTTLDEYLSLSLSLLSYVYLSFSVFSFYPLLFPLPIKVSRKPANPLPSVQNKHKQRNVCDTIDFPRPQDIAFYDIRMLTCWAARFAKVFVKEFLPSVASQFEPTVVVCACAVLVLSLCTFPIHSPQCMSPFAHLHVIITQPFPSSSLCLSPLSALALYFVQILPPPPPSLSISLLLSVPPSIHPLQRLCEHHPPF